MEVYLCHSEQLSITISHHFVLCQFFFVKFKVSLHECVVSSQHCAFISKVKNGRDGIRSSSTRCENRYHYFTITARSFLLLCTL